METKLYVLIVFSQMVENIMKDIIVKFEIHWVKFPIEGIIDALKGQTCKTVSVNIKKMLNER